MPNAESRQGYFNEDEREEELANAERLLKAIFESLDPLSFTVEEILDCYTPLVTHDGQKEDADQVEEESTELLEQQLSALLKYGLIEQHGEVYKVTEDGEKYYKDIEESSTDTDEDEFEERY